MPWLDLAVMIVIYGLINTQIDQSGFGRLSAVSASWTSFSSSLSKALTSVLCRVGTSRLARLDLISSIGSLLYNGDDMLAL